MPVDFPLGPHRTDLVLLRLHRVLVDQLDGLVGRVVPGRIAGFSAERVGPRSPRIPEKSEATGGFKRFVKHSCTEETAIVSHPICPGATCGVVLATHRSRRLS